MAIITVKELTVVVIFYTAYVYGQPNGKLFVLHFFFNIHTVKRVLLFWY